MKALVVISHMALAQTLVLSTLVGIFALQDQGGYLSMFLCVVSPFVLGLQIMCIFNSCKE
jgi:hypothetical protein